MHSSEPAEENLVYSQETKTLQGIANTHLGAFLFIYLNALIRQWLKEQKHVRTLTTGQHLCGTITIGEPAFFRWEY